MSSEDRNTTIHETEVIINNERFRTPVETTGAALYTLAHIEPGLVLYEETPEPHEDRLISSSDHPIHVHGHEKFYVSSPPHMTVTVTVDNVPKSVHRGDYLVSQFKADVGVDASRALDEVICGEFKPLDDNAHIRICGGEVFISHVRQGGSS